MARLGNVIESSALTGVPLTLDDATRLSLQKQVNEGADANAAMLEQLRMLTEVTIASMQANQTAAPVVEPEPTSCHAPFTHVRNVFDVVL